MPHFECGAFARAPLRKTENASAALRQQLANSLKLLERAKGFEPSTPTLASLCLCSPAGQAALVLEGKSHRQPACLQNS
jgi:hypothetical protein